MAWVVSARGDDKLHGDLSDSLQPLLLGDEPDELNQTNENKANAKIVVDHLLPVSGGAGAVDVPVEEHLFELSFTLGPEAALPIIGGRVFESTEKHIPNG